MTVLSTLSLTLLALTVVGGSPVLQIRDSPISLPIAARINATGGSLALLEADRARFAAIRAQVAQHRRGLQPRKQVPVTIANPGVTYICEVGVGSPPTSYALIVDTGSSNTWVGAGKRYVVTKTSHKTSNNVSVSYGSGSFTGNEYTDTVTLGPASIKVQSIGVATEVQDITGADGILGIGPADLTVGTLSPDTSASIPTVTDNLKSQRLISAASVGISFEPTIELNEKSGQLDFGGTDSSKFISPIRYVGVTDLLPSSLFWGITQTVTYGSSTPIFDNPLFSDGIVDTGTTLLLLPSDSFQKYQTATGGELDQTTGLLKISYAQFKKLESLFFNIGGIHLEFTPNAQIWPRSQNVVIGGEENAIYLIVADSGANTYDPTAIQFINGFVWLQRFYTVYDTDHHRIGFANTHFTDATTN